MTKGVEFNKKMEAVKKKRRNNSHVIGGKAVTEDNILEKNEKLHEWIIKKSNISSKCEIGVTKLQKRRRKMKPKTYKQRESSWVFYSISWVSLFWKVFSAIDWVIRRRKRKRKMRRWLCCVCKRFYMNSRNIYEVAIVRWAKCETCEHWVHLLYCTSTRVVRRNTPFKCPCSEN